MSRNKKTKETTIQINTVKGNDKRFVKVFAQKFVKEIIERVSKGMNVEELFEKEEAKVACKVCKKRFSKEVTLLVHMKKHVTCPKCEEGFKSQYDLKKHVVSVQSSKIVSENILKKGEN